MNYPVAVLLSLVLICNTGIAAEFNRSICINAFKAADYQQALGQCTGVAENGDMDAAFIVARLYAQGIQGQPDLSRSVKWLKHAAQLGHAEAAYNLGVAYQYGRGAQQDLAKAREAYQQAADANNPKALRNLAVLYETGIGVEQDLAKAFFSMRRLLCWDRLIAS
ncbi:MAG: tetratricopeptide repeat protein [Amphritea sp.]